MIIALTRIFVIRRWSLPLTVFRHGTFAARQSLLTLLASINRVWKNDGREKEKEKKKIGKMGMEKRG